MKTFVIKSDFFDSLSNKMLRVGDTITVDEKREHLLQLAEVLGDEVVEENVVPVTGEGEGTADSQVTEITGEVEKGDVNENAPITGEDEGITGNHGDGDERREPVKTTTKRSKQ